MINIPGFKRIQVAYTIKRGKRQMIVPIELLTDEEVEAKVAELRRMAANCDLHADEMDRYFQERKPAT